MTQQSFPGPVQQQPHPVTPQQFGGYGPQPRSAGLAVASLVLGILAILGCLIPLLNLFSMFLALVGGVLGIISLVRAMGGKGMAIAGVILAALAIITAVVVNVAFGAAVDSVSKDLATTPAADRPAATAQSAADLEATAPAAPAAQFEVGQTATTGDYSVTVTGVDTNANDVVAQANMFNQEPTGQYVLVDVAVTYNGSATGTPWVDLDWTYLGTDARDYDPALCAMEGTAMNQPDLRTGGTASYKMCFDVPAAAVSGGAVEAKEFLEDPQTWAVK